GAEGGAGRPGRPGRSWRAGGAGADEPFGGASVAGCEPLGEPTDDASESDADLPDAACPDAAAPAEADSAAGCIRMYGRPDRDWRVGGQHRPEVIALAGGRTDARRTCR